MKLLLVDGNHLSHRAAFAQSDLTYNSKPTGMMFGFFKSLLKCKTDYPLYEIVVCWDCGHERRDKESRKAVEEGIVPEAYKENRGKKQNEQYELVKWQIGEQWGPLKEGLSFTSVFQVQKKGYEADDIIATYALDGNSICTIVSSDKDYYQLLEPGLVLYDPIKESTMTIEKFKSQYGLEDSQQWVDVGALAGDSGDNIFGVPGVGEVTATKLIAQYKTVDKLLAALHEQDIQGLLTSKKLKAILEHEARVKLAYRLKQMDYAIPDLPKVVHSRGDGHKLAQFFETYGFESLLGSVSRLV